MNNILLMLFSLSISGSILTCILLIIRPFIKDIFSHNWQYYIWLVVILRFMLPIAPQVEFTNTISNISSFMQMIYPQTETHLINNSADTTFVTGEAETILSYQYPSTEVAVGELDKIVPEAFSEASEVIHPNTSKSNWFDQLRENIWIVWFAVMIMIFIYKTISYHTFVRFIKVRAEYVANTEILDLYLKELKRANIKHMIPLGLNDRAGSPMLIGMIHPMLILPSLDFSMEHMQNIFRHEFTHYKRGDIFCKWFVQLAKCIHWFNPLIYFAGKKIDQSCELSCDEAVIRSMDEDERISYGDTLIASLKSQENYSTFVISTMMSDNKKNLKERLDLLLNYKKKSGLVISITAFLTIFILFGFACTGVYAVNKMADSATVVSLPSEYPMMIATETIQESESGTMLGNEPIRITKSENKFSLSTFVISPLQASEITALNYGLYGIEEFMGEKRLNAYVEFQNNTDQNVKLITFSFDGYNSDDTKVISSQQNTNNIGHMVLPGERMKVNLTLPANVSVIYLTIDKYITEDGIEHSLTTNNEVVFYVGIEEAKSEDNMSIEENMNIANPNDITIAQYSKFSIGDTPAVKVTFLNNTKTMVSNVSATIRMSNGLEMMEVPYHADLTIPSGEEKLHSGWGLTDGVEYFEIAIISYTTINDETFVVPYEKLHWQEMDVSNDIPINTAEQSRQDAQNMDSLTQLDVQKYEIIDGKITIPFSIDSITDGYVCLGQIPDVNNAKRVIYKADAESGNGLFVGMQTMKNTTISEEGTVWYHYVSGDDDVDYSYNKDWNNRRYSGDYNIYVGTLNTALTNVSGTIIIEY